MIDLGGPGKGKPLDSTDALAEFHSEADLAQDVPVSAPRATQPTTPSSRAAGVSFPARIDTHSSPFVWIAILLAAVAIAEAPFVAMWIWDRPARAGNTATAAANAHADYGTVYVETEPAGMEVWVNGAAAGRTPTQLSIPIGEAEIQLRHEDRVRTLPLTIVSEEVLRLRVELPVSPEKSVEWSDSVRDTPTDIVVVVSAQAEDIEAIAVDDITVEVPSAEQDSTALVLAQQSPTP